MLRFSFNKKHTDRGKICESAIKTADSPAQMKRP